MNFVSMSFFLVILLKFFYDYFFYQAFEAADGMFVIAAGNNKHFKNLCKVSILFVF